MLGSFRFKHFKDKILLTNDAGEYCFLSASEWKELSCRKLPITKSKELVTKHFWIPGDMENYIRSTVNQVQDNHAYLFQPTGLFILALTNRCNNACLYCQAHGGRQEADMSPATAKRIIDKIAISPSTHLSIEFQGGEPLCNLPAIYTVMEYAPEHLPDKKVEYNLVSNLSLLTEKTAEYIKNHRIKVSTSLDGPKRLHDLNRPGKGSNSSYDEVIRGIQLLRNFQIEIGAIETTTRFSLAFWKEIVDTYVELGLNTVFLRPLSRLGKAAKCWDTLGYSSAEFIEFYSNALDYIIDLNISGIRIVEQHASIFLTKILGGYSPNYMELRSPCGAGIGQLAFTANGNVYTCDEGRMLAEAGEEAFLLGNIADSSYDEWLNCPSCKAVMSASLLETLPGCCDCIYQAYCGVCPVANYALTGDMHKAFRSERCRINQGILDKLMSLILENNPKKMDVLKSWVQIK